MSRAMDSQTPAAATSDDEELDLHRLYELNDIGLALRVQAQRDAHDIDAGRHRLRQPAP